jgi:uncharacterized protein with HEPN domain
MQSLIALFLFMSPDERGDTATLGDAVAACLKVMEYVHDASRPDLDHDNRLLSACCYQIAVIGEAVKRVSQTTRSKHSEIHGKTSRACGTA